MRAAVRTPAIEYLAVLAGHDRAVAFGRDDGRDYFALGFFNRIELSVRQPRRRRFPCQSTARRTHPSSSPALALAATLQPLSRCVRRPSISRQPAIGCKPGHAEFRLRDRVRCDPTAIHETKSPRPTDANSAAASVKEKASASAKAWDLVAVERPAVDFARSTRGSSPRERGRDVSEQ